MPFAHVWFSTPLDWSISRPTSAKASPVSLVPQLVGSFFICRSREVVSARKGTHHRFLVVDPVKQVFHPAPASESERRTAQHASLPDSRSHTAQELALPSVLFALWDHRNSSTPRELCGAQWGKAWCVPLRALSTANLMTEPHAIVLPPSMRIL